jgi:hypothetical protein
MITLLHRALQAAEYEGHFFYIALFNSMGIEESNGHLIDSSMLLFNFKLLSSSNLFIT